MKYRILQEGGEFIPQYRRWYWPFWSNFIEESGCFWGSVRYYSTLEGARNWIKRCRIIHKP